MPYVLQPLRVPPEELAQIPGRISNVLVKGPQVQYLADYLARNGTRVIIRIEELPSFKPRPSHGQYMYVCGEL